MIKAWHKTLASAAIFGLAACASQPFESAPPAASSSVAAPSVQGAGVRIGALTPRKLAAGECALFLWARTSERKMVFFGGRDGVGKAVIDGREVSLTRETVDGRELLGQYESQSFAYQGHHLLMQLGFEQRPGLDRGAIISQGTLRLKQADGWEYILPVGGLVACESA